MSCREPFATRSRDASFVLQRALCHKECPCGWKHKLLIHIWIVVYSFENFVTDKSIKSIMKQARRLPGLF